jgi:hypothetical protein
MDLDRAHLALALLALAGCYRSHGPPAPADAFEGEPPIDCGGGVYAEPEVCGDGHDQDCDWIDPPCPVDVCPTAVTVRQVVELEFPDPEGCPWGVDDNGGTRDGFYRARTEQVGELDLPAGTVLCSMQVEVPEQEILFDDELIVTYAGAVLVQSFRPEGVFAMEDGIPRYRWADLHGRRLGDGAGTFCLGEDGACTLPASEQVGRFTLDLSGDTGLHLAEIAIQEGRTDFTVVTTGDNNRDSDCRHTPFTLRVTVETAGE